MRHAQLTRELADTKAELAAVRSISGLETAAEREARDAEEARLREAAVRKEQSEAQLSAQATQLRAEHAQATQLRAPSTRSLSSSSRVASGPVRSGG